MFWIACADKFVFVLVRPGSTSESLGLIRIGLKVQGFGFAYYGSGGSK